MKLLVFAFLVASAAAVPFRYRGSGGGRIVGGYPARQGEFPYILSFQDTSHSTPFHFCGASIYNERTMITAGHCVFGEIYDNPRNLRIVAGEQDLDVVSGIEQARDVIRIKLHESYDPSDRYCDISLLFVRRPLNFNSDVVNIPLAHEKDPMMGTARVSGWGTTFYGGPPSSGLRYVDVPIVRDEICEYDYGANQIADSMMCAGQTGKDSCQGDSGGPLACGGLLCGIASWGIGCAEQVRPHVYTEVAYFKGWIEDNAV